MAPAVRSLQSQADRLQSDVEGLRRRCAELAARLRESQQAGAQLQVGRPCAATAPAWLLCVLKWAACCSRASCWLLCLAHHHQPHPSLSRTPTPITTYRTAGHSADATCCRLCRPQASLAAKEQLTAAQQQTIQQLEATIQEQQADIRSALDLVSSRPGRGAGAGILGEGEAGADVYPAYGGLEFADGETGLGAGYFASGDGWEEAPPPPGQAGAAAVSGDCASWQADVCGGDFGSASGRLSSLLDAATAAADAAAAWVGGYGDGGTAAAAPMPGPDAWPEEEYYGSSEAGWTIPAAGSTDSWPPPSDYCSPQRAAGTHASPSKQAAAAGQPQRHCKGHQPSATHSLPCSPPVPGLASVEADIAGLEAALRTALGGMRV